MRGRKRKKEEAKRIEEMRKGKGKKEQEKKGKGVIFFLMIRRPQRYTLYPNTRSSDLSKRI